MVHPPAGTTSPLSTHEASENAILDSPHRVEERDPIQRVPAIDAAPI
jgi:hypothetical protein